MENDIIPTVGVLVVKDRKILLVRHGAVARHLDGKYGLPAGRKQGDESERETAIRELKEETGLEIKAEDMILLPRQWQSDIERKDGAKRFSIKVFLAKKHEGRLSGGAETIPEWISMEDIGKYDLLPNIEDIVTEGMKLLPSQK